ncbi:MAG: CHAT domain-containing protein, partial [Chitinophagales bacterium]
EIAFELYELLIAPIKSLITNHQSLITNLKIIPAGILNTIPFEALLTEKVATNTKYADLPYLLLQYDISYHYSATLWHQALQNIDEKQMEARSILEEASFVGFAPVYKNEQKQSLDEAITSGLYNEENTRSIRIGAETYSELIHSEEEVNSVQSYFNAQNIPTETYLHTEANTSNFLQNIGKHKYVLISAHGFYNEEQPDLTGIILSPRIAKNPEQSGQASPTPEFPLWRGQGEVNGDVRSGQMSPNHKGVGESSLNSEPSSIFYLSDAYNLQLNADLVVLSCCETGLGKLAIGEGVMALNRGFFYAGAKNVIYTLFKVYDKASCQLTQHLFQHILEQKRYPSALKEAKRQLILEGKAPIHWAGYLLIGE